MSQLFSKYIIQKSDGSPVDPKAQYFVLRIDTDLAARHAVLMYASYIARQNPQFSEELRNWVMSQTESASNTGSHTDTAKAEP